MRIKVELNGQKRAFQVDGFGSSIPQLVRFDKNTRVVIGGFGIGNAMSRRFHIDEDGLGGLSRQISEINGVLRRFGPQQLLKKKSPPFYRPKQGILIYGPKGTGKSLLIDKIAECSWTQVVRLTSENIRSAVETSSTAGIASFFIISDLESIAPRRSPESRSNPTQASLLRQLFDNIRGSQGLIVAETRHPNDIDESLRAPDRFGTEIEMLVPTADSRYQILRAIRGTSDEPSDILISDIAERTHGYVGADLYALLQTAVEMAEDREELAVQPFSKTATNGKMRFPDRTVQASEKNDVSLQNDKSEIDDPPDDIGPSPPMFSEKGDADPKDAKLQNDDLQNHVSSSDDDRLTITAEDISQALSRIRPTAMQEIFLETPKVRWSDIGGQHEIKRRLRLAIERPLKFADRIAMLDYKPKKGVLLYGPPGCSKTMLVKALAAEAGLNFLAVKGAEIVSMYVGESERAVREIFRKARAASPSIVFFDEIDSIASRRDGSGSGLRVVETLLNEMDGFEELRNVFVVGATNKPEQIDSAMMRPGRFDDLVYVGLPDFDARREILQLKFNKARVFVDDWDLADAESEDATPAGLMASATEGYSGAEIINICQTAAELAMDHDRDHITWADLQQALKVVPRRISKDVLDRYESWNQRMI